MVSTATLDAAAESLIGAPWRRPSGALPRAVYHYTDAAGLYGMLSTKRIWATDCRFLNDELEGELGKARAKEAVRSAMFKEKDDRKRRYYRELLEALREDREDRNFIFSLSSRKDDLSQWRAYARDGQGFTIGFDTKKLLESARTLDSFGFSKVSYSQRLFDQRLRNVIDTFQKQIFDKELSIADLDQLIENASVNFEWIVASHSVLFKHSSFSAEREWRVNTYRFAREVSHDVRVRPCGNRLVPYIELKLCSDEDGCLPISEIGIGPGFKQSSTRYAVERLCELNDLEVPIYDADTPFRRL